VVLGFTRERREAAGDSDKPDGLADHSTYSNRTMALDAPLHSEPSAPAAK